MRLLGVHLSSGLLLASMVAGCHRDIGHQEPRTLGPGVRPLTASLRKNDRVGRVTELNEARHRNAPRDSESIVVRAEYFAARGPCIHGTDGSWAMPVMDSFHVVQVIRGRLLAKVIEVRPLSYRGPSYPKGLEEGGMLSLRLKLSDKSLKQAEENEHRDFPWLIVNGDEVEQIDTP